LIALPAEHEDHLWRHAGPVLALRSRPLEEHRFAEGENALAQVGVEVKVKGLQTAPDLWDIGAGLAVEDDGGGRRGSGAGRPCCANGKAKRCGAGREEALLDIRDSSTTYCL
jgi:hypothetical protein